MHRWTVSQHPLRKLPKYDIYQSQFSKLTIVAGIKAVKDDTGLINWVYDYVEVPPNLSESYPVQVKYSPSNIPEIDIDVYQTKEYIKLTLLRLNKWCKID